MSLPQRAAYTICSIHTSLTPSAPSNDCNPGIVHPAHFCQSLIGGSAASQSPEFKITTKLLNNTGHVSAKKWREKTTPGRCLERIARCLVKAGAGWRDVHCPTNTGDGQRQLSQRQRRRVGAQSNGGWQRGGRWKRLMNHCDNTSSSLWNTVSCIMTATVTA